MPEPAEVAPATEHADDRPLPAGTWCVGCGYNLAGLRADGVCPECGLDIAVSWPVWDLRQCHGAYVRHVRAEVGAIGVAAVMMAAAAAVLGLAMALEGSVLQRWLPGDAQAAAVLLGFIVLLLTTLPLGRLERRWRTHPRVAHAWARGPRRLFTRGMGLMLVGFVVLMLPGAVAAVFLVGVGSVIAAVGGLCMVGGGAAIYVSALRYADLVMHRAGGTARNGRLEAALRSLPLGLVVLLPVAALGRAPWLWIAAAAMLGAAIAAGALAVRCLGVRRVLGAIVSEKI